MGLGVELAKFALENLPGFIETRTALIHAKIYMCGDRAGSVDRLSSP